MAMRQGTDDAKTLRADGEGRLMTIEQETQPRKNVFGPVSEIGQGAVLDLALVAEGLAQENARGRIAVGYRLDIHGDKNTNKLHGYVLEPKNRPNQVLKRFNGRLPDRSSG